MTNETLGTFLLRMRGRRGLTQSRLADLAGLSHGAIGHVEAGTRSISTDTMNALADALELDDAERAEFARLRGIASGDLSARDVRQRLAAVEGQLAELVSMVEELMLRRGADSALRGPEGPVEKEEGHGPEATQPGPSNAGS